MDAFSSLKEHLVQAPVLAYPQFHHNASEFVLQTDASAVGLGAVLEQDGHVVAYASRSLTAPERQYSVIQRECLAVVYALKQFCHYLLGWHFKFLTDHAPLQWLSAQKMEGMGMLCRWMLAMQEYDFQIVYCKGSSNSNADALSGIDIRCAVTLALPHYNICELQAAQHADNVLSTLLQARSHSQPPPPLRRYKQLWSQLQIVDGVLCHSYIPDLTADVVTVPILPTSFHQQAFHRNHDIPSAGHQGSQRTLSPLSKSMK